MPEININADRDTNIRANAVTTNYGTATTMLTQTSGVSEKNSLIGFTLTDIPSGANISEALIYIYHHSLTHASAYEDGGYRITSSWAETTVTWNTKPTYDTGTNWFTYLLEATGWFDKDITELVQKWHNGTWDNHGIAMYRIKGANDAQYRTREYAGDFAPYLKVTYTKPASGILYWALG